jgi:hypothetical protein
MGKKILLLLLALCLLDSCDTGDSDLNNDSSDFRYDAGDTLIVTLNSGQSETLSLINISNSDLLQYAVGTGRVPNDMLFLRDTLYLLNSSQQSISIYSLTPEPVHLREIALGNQDVNLNPWNLATDGTWLWVSCFLQDLLLRVHPATGQQQAYATGRGPEGVLCHDGLVIVTNTNYNFTDYSWGVGSITIRDGATGDSVATVEVDLNPQRLLLTPDGNLGVMCTGDYTNSGSMLELEWDSWNLIQRRELACDPVDACFQDDILLLAAGGWDDSEEFPGVICQMNWSTGDWLHSPTEPLSSHRAAMGLLPLQSGFLVACFGSGLVDRFNADGLLIESWAAGDGVQMLLQLPEALVH